MPVSRSEAGQQKALLVLDTEWRELERIPLDLGARHFSLASAVPEVPYDLRAGDRCGQCCQRNACVCVPVVGVLL